MTMKEKDKLIEKLKKINLKLRKFFVLKNVIKINLQRKDSTIRIFSIRAMAKISNCLKVSF